MRGVLIKMTTEKDYEIGESYYENGEYKMALRQFEKCIILGDYHNCLNYIGLCHIRLKQYELAAKAFKDILDDCHDSVVPVINLGRVYLYQGLLTEAFEMFNSAINIDPYDEDPYFYLGVYYEKIKKYEEAIKCYEKSLSINIKQSETHLNLGICYRQLYLYKESLKEFDLAYKYDDECLLAKQNKGTAYVEMKDYTNALNEFLFIIKKYPKYIENIIDIVHCYYKLNDFLNAHKWIRKVLDIEPNNEYANKMLKRIKVREGKRGELG